MDPLARRSHHLVYVLHAKASDGRAIDLVARIPKNNKPSRQAALYREHIVLRLLGDKGFKYAPRALMYDCEFETLQLPYAIQTYVPSTPMQYLSADDAVRLAAEVAEVHDIDCGQLLELGVPYCPSPEMYISIEMRHLRSWMRRTIEWAFGKDDTSKTLLGSLESGLEAVEQDLASGSSGGWSDLLLPTLIHGDLGLHNLGKNQDVIELYDWELATIGDPAYEIAKLFHADSSTGSEQQESFLNEYRRKVRRQAATDYFARRVPVYEGIVALQNAIWAISQAVERLPEEGATEDWLLRGKVSDLLKRHVYKNLDRIYPNVSKSLHRTLSVPEAWRRP